MDRKFPIHKDEPCKGSGNARPEHAPGDPAPAAGTCEQRNIFGRSVGTRVNLAHGQSMPSAPLGHTWTRAKEEAEEC
jgi:hypothetical protein